MVSHATMTLRGKEHQGAKTAHSENSFHIPKLDNHYKERLSQNSNISPATPMCQQYRVNLLFQSKTGKGSIELEELVSFDNVFLMVYIKGQTNTKKVKIKHILY